MSTTPINLPAPITTRANGLYDVTEKPGGSLVGTTVLGAKMYGSQAVQFGADTTIDDLLNGSK